MLLVCVHPCGLWHLQGTGWGGREAHTFIWRPGLPRGLREGLNTTSPCPALLLRCVMVGLVPLEKSHRPGWTRENGMEWELGLGQDLPAGAVDHRVTVMAVNAPRRNKWWQWSWESKSGSETRLLRIVLSLVLERVSLALAQAMNSSAADWTPHPELKTILGTPQAACTSLDALPV